MHSQITSALKISMMRSLAVVAVAVSALALPAVASADGSFSSITARYGQSPIVHYRIRYQVYDSAGYCEQDEYGFYQDFACMDYDDNDAKIDVRIYRIKAHSLQLVEQETAYGWQGRASEDVYSFQLFGFNPNPRKGMRFRAKFRLIDPVTDTIVDRRSRDFSVTTRAW